MAPRKKSSQSAKEKLEIQREKARERQRKRRANLRDEELEKKRQYDRDRYKKEKEQKKKKSVKEMSEREQRKIRKMWREQYKRKKQKKAALAAALNETPPDSPNIRQPEIPSQESSQRKRGRKAVRRDKSAAYRKIHKQEKRIQELERRLKKYKKRLERHKKKTVHVASPSPKKQVAQLVGKETVSPGIRKQLFVGYALQKQLEKKVKEISGQKKKVQQFRKEIGSNILKKYRVQTHFKRIIPYKSNKKLEENVNKRSVRRALSKELMTFFEDDSVSRICPGKKDVIRKGKVTKQRRVLLDTLKNLQIKFQEESKKKISLSSFRRSRPFWVTFPKSADRTTCACMKHENFNFIIHALRSVKCIDEKNATEVMRSLVCNVKKKKCMFGNCNKCKNKQLKFSYDGNFQVKYWKWMNVKEERKIKNKKMVVKKTTKVKLVKPVTELIKLFQKEVVEFKKHLYSYLHQNSKLNNLLKRLKPKELVFRIDFAENYVAKYAKEIQSIHFGASKKQLSLHTGVRYSNYDSQPKTSCFSTISNNLDHQSHAVWAHLEPILQKSAAQFPDIDTIHFFSDSPSSQYRNRNNIFLFKTEVPKIFPKLHSMSWNFTEAGHGKGTMDGVGGALKREADRAVSHGLDINDAAGFKNALKNVDIFLTEISSSSIEKRKKDLGWKVIPAIDGILKCHQITYHKGGSMFGNSLSCFTCNFNKPCSHHHLFEVFPNVSSTTRNKKLRVDDVYSSDSDLPLEPEDAQPVTAENIMDQPDVSNNILQEQEDAQPVTLGEIVDQLHDITIGSFVIIKTDHAKCNPGTSKGEDFVAICQSELVQDEFQVMFMKPCKNDNATFLADDSDVSYVHLNQVVSVLPMPRMLLRGNRIFYKFEQPPLDVE